MSGADPSDKDIAATAPTILIKVAAATQALCGLFTALVGLQLTMALRFPEAWMRLIPYTQVVLGIGALVVGALTYRARTAVAVVNAALGALLCLVMGVWLVVSLLWGIFSCMTLMAALSAVVATIFGIAAIAPARRATAARERLLSEGIDLGL